MGIPVRSPADVEQLLLELPELTATVVTHPAANVEVLRVGRIETEGFPVDVSVNRRRHKSEPRTIWLDFFPRETPGDSWGVKLTPDQARRAAAELVAAARAAEEAVHA
jgi:hypothetical protein